jgi:hypothetical protein
MFFPPYNWIADSVIFLSQMPDTVLTSEMLKTFRV